MNQLPFDRATFDASKKLKKLFGEGKMKVMLFIKNKTSRRLLILVGILICFNWNKSFSWGQSNSSETKQSVSRSVLQSSSSSVIYGAVLSSKDKKPLPNVPITLKNKETGSIISKSSDNQGAFIFRSLPPGPYQILVGGGRFSIQKKDGILADGMVGEMNFQVMPLTKGNSSLVGKVFTGHNNHRLPVTAQMAIKNIKTGETYTILSDTGGVFSLNKIPSGTYIVQVQKEGYVPVVETVSINGLTNHDFRLSLNRLAQENINANANNKIKDSTGAISVVGRKKFAENQTTGLGYVLMQTPSVNYYSRSGANGITGGMEYFMCRGYTTGGSNTAPSSASNIEFSVEGVPMNNDVAGEVYDLNLMNNDIASVEIQRGVTTSMQLGNYASGCAVNIHLVQPSRDAYAQLTSGYGSYGLIYDSFITNTGLSKKYNAAAYNDLSVLNMNGFQEYTNYQEYQDYGNLTKYLSNGDIKLIFTGAYKNYDRGGSMSLQDFNLFGPTYNGTPNGAIPTAPSGVNNPVNPYYKDWIFQRYMVSIQSNNEINDKVDIKNNLFAFLIPYGVIDVPAVQTGTTSVPGIGTITNQTLDYGGNGIGPVGYGSLQQYGNPYNFNYIEGQGFKVGDIVESGIKLWDSNNPILGKNTLHIGFRLSDQNLLFQANPLLATSINGYAQSASLELLTVGGYMEDHWRPSNYFLISAGFRVMAEGEQYSDHSSAATFIPNNPQYGLGAGGVTTGENFDVFLPHIGVNYYPSTNWKVYGSAGQSFSPPSVFFWANRSATDTPITVLPEIIDDYQIGTRYGTDKGFFAFDAYHDYIMNMFTQSLVTITPGTAPVSLPTQAGAAQMQGLEGEFKYVIGSGFSIDGNYSITDATYLSAVYNAGTNHQFSNTGDMLPFVPTQLANLDLNYAAGNWHATINERYMGNMNVIDTAGGPNSNSNVQENSPGYFVTNLILAYDLPSSSMYKSAQLFFNAFNLLNTNYYNPAFLTTGANRIETLFVYPGEPINLFGGITLTF